MPPELVGAWCGGPDDPPGHWTYIFEADGTFGASNPRMGVVVGTAVVEGSTLSLYDEEGGVDVRSVGYFDDPVVGPLLFIDDYSYVVGMC